MSWFKKKNKRDNNRPTIYCMRTEYEGRKITISYYSDFLNINSTEKGFVDTFLEYYLLAQKTRPTLQKYKLTKESNLKDILKMLFTFNHQLKLGSTACYFHSLWIPINKDIIIDISDSFGSISTTDIKLWLGIEDE